MSSLSGGSNVLTIGTGAFSSCSGLEMIVLSGRLTSIGDEAFFRCSKLVGITIPSRVVTVGNYAFANCEALEMAIIGKNVVTMGESVFDSDAKLTMVTFMGSTEPSSCPSSAFTGTGATIVDVPSTYSSTDFCGLDVQLPTE